MSNIKRYYFKIIPFSPVLYFVLLGNLINAQFSPQLNFHTIDKSSGLPNNYINAIEMDSLGFLWIATDDGLCRYDSPSKIKVYKEGEIGLASSKIKTIHASQDSLLWIGTDFGGLTKLDIQDNTYKTYNNAGLNHSAISSNQVLSVRALENNEIWIGTENGLNVLYPNNDSVYQFPIVSGSNSQINVPAIMTISEDQNGWIWLGTWDGGLFLYLPSPDGDHSKGKFRNILLGKQTGSRHIWKIFEDIQHNYWLGTHSGGLFHLQLPDNASNEQSNQDWDPIIYNFIHDASNPNSISSDYIFDITEDAKNNLWISSIKGLNILKKDEFKNHNWTELDHNKKLNFEKHFANPKQIHKLSNNQLTKVFKDKDGLMWLGSVSGINQYNWYTNQFEIYPVSLNHESSANSFEPINCIYKLDAKTVILGSDTRGLLYYDIENKILLNTPNSQIEAFNNRVTSFYSGSDKLYVGTPSGIGLIDMTTKRERLYRFASAINTENQNVFISSIFKDSEGRLWCGTESGLAFLNENTGEYIWFNYDHNDNSSISDNSITQIYEDTYHNIWVSTYNGLNLLKNVDGQITFQRFKGDGPNQSENITSNQITSIAEYAGKIYFGSKSGIFIYNPPLKSFSILGEGSVQNMINNMLITDEGIMWASTSDGVLRLNLSSGESKLYGKNDGIGDISFRTSASHKDSDGNFYFGSNEGFLKINDSEIKRNIQAPEIFFTDIKTINSNSEQRYNGITNQTITLPSDNYYISIDFTALNYNQPEYNKYMYKLDGFNEENWQMTGVQQVVYTNLEAGDYTFNLKASNNEGVWNDKGRQLHIIVKPAFIETIWFKLLLGLLAIIIVRIANLVYSKNIRKRNEFLKDYNEKLNNQVKKTEDANARLGEREKYLKLLLEKLDRSNQELIRSNKDLEQFAYIASHDMKEPLRTVGTFTNLINKKYSDKLEKEGLQYMGFVIEGVERMSALINSLLSYSQVGKKDTEFKKNNLKNIVDTKIADLSKVIDDRNAIIECEKLPSVYCEGNQIGIVFYNLILNGIKFNKAENPLIRITTKETDTHWEFFVEDNGIGISNQYQDQIFEIFKRLHTREEYEGTGIGLALCNKIIDRHNGSIFLESTLGKGSVFCFTISKNIKPDQNLTKLTNNSSLGKAVKEILRA